MESLAAQVASAPGMIKIEKIELSPEGNVYE